MKGKRKLFHKSSLGLVGFTELIFALERFAPNSIQSLSIIYILTIFLSFNMLDKLQKPEKSPRVWKVKVKRDCRSVIVFSVKAVLQVTSVQDEPDRCCDY